MFHACSPYHADDGSPPILLAPGIHCEPSRRQYIRSILLLFPISMVGLTAVSPPFLRCSRSSGISSERERPITCTKPPHGRDFTVLPSRFSRLQGQDERRNVGARQALARAHPDKQHASRRSPRCSAARRASVRRRAITG